MNTKYELTDEAREYYGRTVYRIRALKDFDRVKKGELGGFVESEKNLSPEGNCWIFNNSVVCMNAVVKENAQVFGRTDIHGEATIFGAAKISGNYAIIRDNVLIGGDSVILGKVTISGRTLIFGTTHICGHDSIGAPYIADVYLNNLYEINGSTHITKSEDVELIHIFGDNITFYKTDDGIIVANNMKFGLLTIPELKQLILDKYKDKTFEFKDTYLSIIDLVEKSFYMI